MCLGKIRKLYIHIPPTPLPKFSAFVFLACLSEVVWFEGRDWVFAPPKSLFSENSACISISEICSSFLGAKLTSSDDFDRPYECLSVRPYVFPSVRVVTISSLTADRSKEYFLITCRKHCHMFLPIWVVSLTFSLFQVHLSSNSHTEERSEDASK